MTSQTELMLDIAIILQKLYYRYSHYTIAIILQQLYYRYSNYTIVYPIQVFPLNKALSTIFTFHQKEEL